MNRRDLLKLTPVAFVLPLPIPKNPFPSHRRPKEEKYLFFRYDDKYKDLFTQHPIPLLEDIKFVYSRKPSGWAIDIADRSTDTVYRYHEDFICVSERVWNNNKIVFDIKPKYTIHWEGFNNIYNFTGVSFVRDRYLTIDEMIAIDLMRENQS